jgi:hypothetical protein
MRTLWIHWSVECLQNRMTAYVHAPCSVERMRIAQEWHKIIKDMEETFSEMDQEVVEKQKNHTLR